MTKSAAILAGAALLAAGCHSSQRSTIWKKVVEAPRPALDTEDTQRAYAGELHKLLLDKRVPHKIVTAEFNYIGEFGHPRFGKARRTVVVYRDTTSKGDRWWLMDDRLSVPMWLPNSPLEKQISFYLARPAKAVDVRDFMGADTGKIVIPDDVVPRKTGTTSIQRVDAPPAKIKKPEPIKPAPKAEKPVKTAPPAPKAESKIAPPAKVKPVEPPVVKPEAKPKAEAKEKPAPKPVEKKESKPVEPKTPAPKPADAKPPAKLIEKEAPTTPEPAEAPKKKEPEPKPEQKNPEPVAPSTPEKKAAKPAAKSVGKPPEPKPEKSPEPKKPEATEPAAKEKKSATGKPAPKGPPKPAVKAEPSDKPAVKPKLIDKSDETPQATIVPDQDEPKKEAKPEEPPKTSFLRRLFRKIFRA